MSGGRGRTQSGCQGLGRGHHRALGLRTRTREAPRRGCPPRPRLPTETPLPPRPSPADAPPHGTGAGRAPKSSLVPVLRRPEPVARAAARRAWGHREVTGSKGTSRSDPVATTARPGATVADRAKTLARPRLSPPPRPPVKTGLVGEARGTREVQATGGRRAGVIEQALAGPVPLTLAWATGVPIPGHSWCSSSARSLPRVDTAPDTRGGGGSSPPATEAPACGLSVAEPAFPLGETGTRVAPGVCCSHCPMPALTALPSPHLPSPPLRPPIVPPHP